MDNKFSKYASIILVIGIIIGLELVVFGGYNFLENPILSIISILVGYFVVFLAYRKAINIELKYGIYICRKCGHFFTPSIKEYILAPHIRTIRYLKCPECEKRNWCCFKI